MTPGRPVVTSTRNPRVRATAKLARRRERRLRGAHLVEGPRAVKEALAAGLVEELYVTPAVDDLMVPDGVASTVVSDHVLGHLADARAPQGVVAVARSVTPPLESVVGHGILAVLDGVSDPGNVGTIIRTADAAGIHGVVATEGCADVFGPKAIRAAAGSTYHLPVVVDVSLAQTAAAVRAAHQRLFGLDVRAQRSVYDVTDRDLPCALVFGSEAHGLSDPASLDDLIAVPMAGQAESLNVAAAAAVALFAAGRPSAGGRVRSAGP